MASVPVPPTFADGVAPTSLWNQLVGAVQFLQSPPRAELRQGTTPTTLTTGVWTSIGMDTHDVDSDYLFQQGHSDVTNNSRYTNNWAGSNSGLWYALGGGASFAANATGARGVRYAVNSTAVNASAAVVQAVSVALVTTEVPARNKLAFLNLGDYVELQAFQGSGGNLATSVSGASASSLKVDGRSI